MSEPCPVHGTEHMAYVSLTEGPAAVYCLKCADLDPDVLEGSRSQEFIDRINRLLNSGGKE